MLAVEEARAADNSVLGRPVVFLHPDCPDDADAAQSIAVRLMAVNNVAGLIGGPDPTLAERFCRIGQQYKIPVIVPVWLPSPLLGPYGFTLGPLPAEQGKALAVCAGKKLGLRRLALLTDNRNPASVALTDAFVVTLGKSAIVYRGEYASSEQFAEIVKQALAADPDAVLLAGNLADLGKCRSELQRAGLNESTPLLFGGTDGDTLATLTDSGGPLYWTTIFVADGSRPKTQEFSRQYRERFGRSPDAAAALAYDATQVLFEAIRRAKATHSEKVRDELANLQDLEGVTGVITFDKSQAASRPVFVVHRQDQQLKVVNLEDVKPVK